MWGKKVSWRPSGIWYKIVRSHAEITRSQTAICDLILGQYFVGKESFFRSNFCGTIRWAWRAYISTKIAHISGFNFGHRAEGSPLVVAWASSDAETWLRQRQRWRWRRVCRLLCHPPLQCRIASWAFPRHMFEPFQYPHNPDWLECFNLVSSERTFTGTTKKDCHFIYN